MTRDEHRQEMNTYKIIDIDDDGEEEYCVNCGHSEEVCECEIFESEDNY